MAQYDVNNYTVGTILSNIKSGSIAIPEMQRPFVWDSTKVRDLIDSLYQGFPIGYIIVWQNPSVKLKDGTKAIGKKVLIDGQQRITAMSAAIVGQKVLDAHYKWQRISIAFNPLEEKFEVANSANSKSNKWIPDIAPVMEPAFDSFNFVLDYCKKNGIEDQMSRINSVINNLRGIQNNSLGVISLAADLDIDSVTEIFIRINSKGVVLSQADFAMSKISSNEEYGGNVIRKTIDYFCHLLESPEDLAEIKKNDSSFDFSAIEWATKKSNAVYKTSYSDILHVAFTYKFKRGRLSDLVSLLSGRDFETREFRAEIEADSFDQLHKAVLETVNKTNYERFLMIVESTGIVRSSLIRSQNVLNFGYALYLALKERKIDSNEIEQIVRRWLVLSILTSRYSSSPESAFDFDIKRFFAYDDPMEYLKLMEAGELSDAFWNVTLVQRLNTSVASSPYFNLYLMAQAKSHDKGFLSDHIEVGTMLENRGDIHHLFPKNYLIKNNIPQSQYNQIANYAFIQQEINIKIRDDAPCEYMKTVFEQCQTKKAVYGGIVDEEQLRTNLKRNCIPEGFEDMDISDYDAFLESRRKLMAEKNPSILLFTLKETQKMLGAIIGDIVGSVYEFNNIKTKSFPLFRPDCFFTDDTVMTIAVAEAIMNGGARDDFIDSMKKYGRMYPDAGYGGKFRMWLRTDTRKPYGSFGNGSAMRVSPCGWMPEIDECRRLARISAEVTHNHPEGIKGALATADAIFLCRQNIANGGSPEECRALVKKHIEKEYGYDLSRNCNEIRPAYEFNETCQETVPQAVVAFLDSTDFEDAIRNAISLGGDSDTLAAITGSIAEAAYGIPEWIRERALGYLDGTLLGVFGRWEKYLAERKDVSI